MKKYIAKTNVSINIVLGSGGNRHITFSSLTGGGSVFYTDDPEIEKGLERHYKFGTLFRIDHLYKPEKQQSKPSKKETVPEADHKAEVAPITKTEAEPIQSVQSEKEDEPAPETENVEDDTEEEREAEAEYKTVVVTDPDAAKAYLAENFGISRTKLKKIETIKKVAAENGIVFEGI